MSLGFLAASIAAFFALHAIAQRWGMPAAGLALFLLVLVV